MKIFKTIFRLDYPLSFSILDNLGKQLEFIDQNTSIPPYNKTTGNVDLINHSITHSGNINEDIFKIHLSLKSFYGMVEYHQGYKIENLSKHKLFELSDKVIKNLELKRSSNYNRIGIRSWVIIEQERFKFEQILKLIKKSNSLFDSALTEHFPITNDIAMVFEAKSEELGNIRLGLGPYKKTEKERYFSLSPEIEEGLIMDIDIWQPKISIPNFNLIKLLKENQKVYHKLLKKIETNLIRRLEENENK